jgi:hypothetical protein
MLTEAFRAGKQRMLGMGSGSVVALGITSNVQSLLGLHPSLPVGAAFVVASSIVGAIIGGWVAGMAERRVP